MDMLVTMKKKFRMLGINVTGKGHEPGMYIIFSIMSLSGRVVSNKDIHIGKRSQFGCDFRLFKEIVSSGLVLPAAAKSSEDGAVL